MRKLGAGVAGGMLAGALVGAIEALVVWHRGDAGAVPPIGWAVLAYGLVGALGGAGAGLVALVFGTDAFGLAFGGVAAGLGFAVGRTRVFHDVLFDRPPHGLTSVVVQAGAMVAAVAVAVAVWRLLRGADDRRGPLTRPGVVVGLVASVGVAGMLATRFLSPREPSEPPAAAAPAVAVPGGAPNVVLVVVDSLRPDHLSSYGYGRKTSPRIDALAAEGTRYTRAFAPASSTRASMAAIFTGLVPSAHGVIRKGDRLPDRVETLAETLARSGYHTVGFANDSDISAARGFGQGFAEYRQLTPAVAYGGDPLAGELALYEALRVGREGVLPGPLDKSIYCRPAEYVVERARGWLDGPTATRTPFFLYLHFMDPHEPYVVHPIDGTGYGRRAMRNPSPPMIDEITRAYDGEIAYVDEQVGRLVDELRRRGLYDGTLIVVTADHGEELVDHGGWWHGTTLYDEQIAVPLIVKPPRGGIARVADALVSTVDVAPTILAAAGVPTPATMRGVVLPLRAGAVPARESIFAEETTPDGTVLRAVRTRAWKLLTASPDNPRGLPALELYAIADDPNETRNVAAVHPAEREEMRAALGRTVLEARAQVGRAAEPDVDAATKARLKQLGYVD
jgi:arylsulfatase A-like enzyme